LKLAWLPDDVPRAAVVGGVVTLPPDPQPDSKAAVHKSRKIAAVAADLLM
jgi:hypothetical protein